MLNKGHFDKLKVYIVLILIFSGLIPVLGQRSSAEKLAGLPPVSLNTGQEVKDGINNVFFKNNILYVTNVWAGVQAIDVTDPANPKEIGKIATDHRPHNIFIEDNYAYVSDELSGVMIIDVSDPANMKPLGRIVTEGDAFWVIAEFPYVYVAEETKGVGIYDISDITNPQKVSMYDTPGFAWGLAKMNGDLLIADKTGGLQILDVTNPATPKRIGSYAKMKFVRTISIEEPYAYISNGADGLYILNISNPQFPALVSTYSTEGFVFSSFKAGKYVYLANEATQSIEIVNISDVMHPRLEGQYKANGNVYSVWKNDVYLFAAADNELLFLRHNNPPDLADIADQSVNEQTTLTVTPVASDPDGDEILFSIQNLPPGAAFDSLKGSLSWTPNYEQSGNYENVILTVTEQTDSKLFSSDTFSVVVNHVNRAPSIPAVDDQVVDENTPLTFTIAEGADEDKEDAGKLVYRADNLPQGATFDPLTRVFSWTPTFEQSGVYSVDFVVADPPGAVARDASTITVNHVDRKPVMAAIDDKTVAENQELKFTVSGTDPDQEDQNAISFRAENLPQGAAFDPATQTFTWTPTYDQSGEYKDILFIMTAGKMADSTTTGITVNHVNRPPVLEAVAAQTVDENTLLSFALTPSDPDVEDQGKLVVTAENLPQGSVFNADSLLFSWTPTYEQSGSFPDVKFTVTDPSGLSDSKSVAINVEHINRPPVMAEINPVIVDENMPVKISVSGTDPDAEDQAKLTFTPDKLPEGATFDGTTFSWTPTFDQSGQYNIAFTFSDGRLQDVKSLAITVNHVNRAPEIAAVQPQTVDENKPLEFSVTGSDPDTEDQGKFVLSASGLPQGALFDAATGKFSWTPDFDQSGQYTITFNNTDPAGLTSKMEVPITVNHVNRSPVFAAIAPQIVDENSPLQFTIPAGSDADKEDAGKVVYSVKDLPQGMTFDATTLAVSWTPGFDQSGIYDIPVTCSDAEFSVTQNLKVTVNHVNRVPEISVVDKLDANENLPVTFKVTASDPDKEDAGKYVVTVAGLPRGAEFDAASGTFNWTPDYEQSGEYKLTFTNTDPAGLSSAADVVINVRHVNRPPVFAEIAAQTVEENTPLSIVIPEASDPDKEDAGKLSYAAGALAAGALFDGATRTFSWTPTYSQAGSYPVAISCSDGTASVTQILNVTVVNVNRPPTISDIPAKTVDEMATLTFTPQFNDEDEEDNGKLKISTENLPQGATVDETTGTFSWTPGYDQAGNYSSVTLTVTDEAGASASTVVAIKVNNINRKPTVDDPGVLQAKENAVFSYTFTGTDADKEDAGNLAFSASGLPTGAQFSETTATLTWQPDYLQSGDYTFTVTVKDAGGMNDTRQVSIKVSDTNRPPVLNPVESQVVKENRALTFRVSGTDEDSDNTLQYSASDLPSGATFDGASGAFSWRPDFSQAGTYTVNFTVSDGTDEAEGSCTITVENVNRAPKIGGKQSAEVTAGESVTVQFSASDEDGDDLTFSASGLPGGASIDASSGVVSWTPGADQSGEFSFTVTVSDGTDSDTTSGSITVKPMPPSPPKQ